MSSLASPSKTTCLPVCCVETGDKISNKMVVMGHSATFEHSLQIAHNAAAAWLAAFLLASTFAACKPPAPPKGPKIQLDLPLVDHPGHRFSLAQCHGKITIVAFVASWCVPCQSLLSRMLKARAAYGPDDVALVAVATDRQTLFARQFKRDLQIPFPVLVGNAKTMRKAGLQPVPMVPLLYILDRSGHVRYAHRGLVTTKTLAQELDRLLALDR